jgi:putative Mg2+ transporter-C (MgtC) family protein
MNIRSDPMRLAAQIISGVGFLGRESFCTDTTMLFLASRLRQLSGHLPGWNHLRRRFLFSCFFATGLFLLAIKLSPFIIFLQTKNQFPEK